MQTLTKAIGELLATGDEGEKDGDVELALPLKVFPAPPRPNVRFKENQYVSWKNDKHHERVGSGLSSAFLVLVRLFEVLVRVETINIRT